MVRFFFKRVFKIKNVVNRNLNKIKLFLLQNEEGLETVEYILVLAMIIIPLMGIMKLFAEILGAYFRTLAYIVSLPFP